MEAHRHFGKPASGGSKGLNNRTTAALVAAVSAALAAALIYLFVTHYHKTTPAPVVPADVTVWVASQTIPAGTPQSEIAASDLIKARQVPPSQVLVGAISSPSVVAGESTSAAIVAGQQLTAGDFARSSTTATTASSITSFLKGDERGVAFDLDSEHGLTSYLQPNSTVDVMGLNPKASTSTLLAKDVTIIANDSGLVVLRLTDKQALLISAATLTDNLWLTMRPTIKATNSVRVGTVGSLG